ncbi:MAG TPA: FtsX-like permease family protein [Kiritimatiellia bacterium]|nr:FtsX-like permease family protein [Kiritimatiellia bacterium]
MLIRLVFKTLRRGKMRFAMATLGVASATGLMVWSLGLTVTAMGQSRETVRRMTAPFSCWVAAEGAGYRPARGAARPSVPPAALPPQLMESVLSRPEVESAFACRVIHATLDFRPGGAVLQGPPLVTSLTLAPQEGCPYTEAEVTGDWPDPSSPEPVVAICSSVFARRHLPPPPCGTPLVLITPHSTVTVRIGAVIDFPQAVDGLPTAFATIGALRQAAGGVWDPRPNLLLCTLRTGAAPDDLRAATGLPPPSTTTGSAYGGTRPGPNAPARFILTDRRQIEARHVSDNLANFKRQAPLLLTLSVLTAFCLLFNALTLGVAQNVRGIALLRAAGMTVGHVAQMVALEGFIMACCGWTLGLLGGWAALTLFTRRAAQTFPAGVMLGWITPAVTAAGIMVLTLLSLLWPCRRAMRIAPLEALAEHDAASQPDRDTRKRSFLRTACGFALLFPMLVFVLPLRLTALSRSVLLLTVGIPLHLFGLFLLLPGFIRATERLCGPVVSALLALDPVLLHRRISRDIPRTAGMTITLAVGLGSFAAIHIWGSSLTRPFLPSPTFPDVIVSLLPNGVSRSAAGAVALLEGVGQQRCLAIEAVQVPLAPALTTRVARVSGRPSPHPNVLLFGADPRTAFGGDRPLAPFRFVEGEPRQAADALTRNDACLITLMFARETGLRKGGTLQLTKRPLPARARSAPSGSRSEEMVSFTVVGVVDLNWHLVTSRAQMRGRHGMPGGTMGPVFVNEEVARQWSGNTETTCFLWLNFSEAYRAMDPLAAGQRLEADIRKTLAVGSGNTVRVHHRDEIADGTIAHSADLIGDMARAPFWSLIVLSTGMATLLIASFHASAREIAVLRAIGMTRGQLGRLLLAEALMTSVCGIVLSLVSGLCIGWTFTGWTRAWMPFGGLPVTLEIPWPTLFRGIGFAFALCALMALPPILWLVRRPRFARECN